jgi:hypothetical protein
MRCRYKSKVARPNSRRAITNFVTDKDIDTGLCRKSQSLFGPGGIPEVLGGQENIYKNVFQE